MMPKCWLIVVWLAIAAGSVHAAEEPTILGPERVPIGRMVELTAEHVIPAQGEWICLPPTDNLRVDSSGRLAYFSAERNGTYHIAIVRHDPASGQQKTLAYWPVIVGEGEDPPEPPDPPDPPLPPPGSKYRVAVIFEKDDLDEMPPSQAILLSSLAFRERMESAGHKVVALVDQHIQGPKGERPSELVKYLDAIEGDTLPRICLEPIGGGDVVDFPLPVDEDAVFELLSKGTASGREEGSPR
jgi:hypothetical protein